MASRKWAWLPPAVPAAVLLSCASSPPPAATPAPPAGEVATVRHVDRVVNATSSAPLAGARCQGQVGSCRCRALGEEQETDPPAEGQKRFEVRLAADGGSAVLDASGIGRFETGGGGDSCFYVDVPSGRKTDVSFVARAYKVENGVAPRFQLSEYGPKGPWWYEIMAVDCAGPQGRCDRQGIDAWTTRTVTQRRRGRLDPCGSAVVSGLKWETGTGQHERDGGLYADLTVRFALEVKKFATQFAPGSTECVPK
jgi:hypothetical protein